MFLRGHCVILVKTNYQGKLCDWQKRSRPILKLCCMLQFSYSFLITYSGSSRCPCRWDVCFQKVARRPALLSYWEFRWLLSILKTRPTTTTFITTETQIWGDERYSRPPPHFEADCNICIKTVKKGGEIGHSTPTGGEYSHLPPPWRGPHLRACINRTSEGWIRCLTSVVVPKSRRGNARRCYNHLGEMKSKRLADNL